MGVIKLVPVVIAAAFLFGCNDKCALEDVHIQVVVVEDAPVRQQGGWTCDDYICFRTRAGEKEGHGHIEFKYLR